MNKIKEKLKKMKDRFSNYIGETFSSRKKTFKLVALLVFTALFILEVGMLLINNSFYNNASDDVLQYYTIIVDFIGGLKDGTVSWFNLNNYFGASFFSDVYYIPIDIFTGITFLLSYLMNTEIAYSITELIKIFAGVMMFAYYLSLSNMKNRTIFWASILYFIAGGTVSFMAFPVFLSLTFYMPLALVVIHYFFNKKRWIVPLFAMVSIFFDFYLGYTILAFACFAFILEYVKRPGFKFFTFIKELVIFVALLLLGVIMAAVIAYPSVIYILEETYRNTGTFNSWIGLYDLFGLDPTQDLIVTIGDNSYGLLELFQPNIYIRYLAKIFVEQKPIGFYGFENSYATEHFSLYISIIGFAYMSYVWFMRDKISRVYKVAIVIATLLMIIPIFSYIFSGSLDAPYTRWVNMLPIFQLMILAHVFDKHGFEKIKMKYMTIIISLLLVVLGGLIYYYISQLKLDDYLASRDVLKADTILMCVAALYLVLFLIFGWLKKWTVVKVFLWIEIIVAIGYAYSGPFSIRNKVDTFENAYQIEEFLDISIVNDEFYRVYVDINNVRVEDTNFNRMMGYTTNTGIFHSWTDSETNSISKLLYNVNEYQSKNSMNSFGYYLSHFLGYQYVLVDAESDYALDNEYFDLIAADQNYKLYEIEYVTAFSVYESYMTYDEFTSYRNQNSDIATEKILLMAALIDTERYVEEELNLEHLIVANEVGGTIIRSYTTVTTIERVDIAGLTDETVREFYRYSNEDMNIICEAGASYIEAISVDLEDYGEVFMELEDGTKKVCPVMETEDKDYQVKCGEFFSTPVAFYVEATDGIFYAPSLRVRTEAIFGSAAYMVFDLSTINVESETGIIDFAVNSNFNLDKSFVLDDLGNEYQCINGFYSFDSQPVKLYAYKTSKMYNYSNLYNLTLTLSYDDLSDSLDLINQDLVNDQIITVENGKISLFYQNNSDSTFDQIVVVPVCYSDDWIFTDGNDYETISVSGGFLGIVVPNNVNFVSVQMKFEPKGLDTGALISLGGLLVYLGIFTPYWIKNRRKNGDDLECNMEE